VGHDQARGDCRRRRNVRRRAHLVSCVPPGERQRQACSLVESRTYGKYPQTPRVSESVGESGDLRARKREAAAAARRLGVCPACGAELDGPGYGTGRIADGDFCSLACVADYWYGPVK
jgi:hypothetical protein